MDRVRESVTALEGAAAPPRKNGELVFDAPWESRAFGMAVALHGQGAYTWEEFSAHLAAELAADVAPPNDAILPVADNVEETYYERWLTSLETLLMEKGLIGAGELEIKTAEFAAGMWDHH